MVAQALRAAWNTVSDDFHVHVRAFLPQKNDNDDYLTSPHVQSCPRANT